MDYQVVPSSVKFNFCDEFSKTNHIFAKKALLSSLEKPIISDRQARKNAVKQGIFKRF